MLTLCGIVIVVAGIAGIAWLVLPVIGLRERAGLREPARALIARSRQATAARVLTLYFVVRQLAAALGLTALASTSCRRRCWNCRTATA